MPAASSGPASPSSGPYVVIVDGCRRVVNIVFIILTAIAPHRLVAVLTVIKYLVS
jgi:hypothetical protein